MASFNGFVNKTGIFKVSAATKFPRWNSNFNIIGSVVKRKSKFRGKCRNMPARSYTTYLYFWRQSRFLPCVGTLIRLTKVTTRTSMEQKASSRSAGKKCPLVMTVTRARDCLNSVAFTGKEIAKVDFCRIL